VNRLLADAEAVWIAKRTKTQSSGAPERGVAPKGVKPATFIVDLCFMSTQRRLDIGAALRLKKFHFWMFEQLYTGVKRNSQYQFTIITIHAFPPIFVLAGRGHTIVRLSTCSTIKFTFNALTRTLALFKYSPITSS
jgi:hypothetical protein